MSTDRGGDGAPGVAMRPSAPPGEPSDAELIAAARGGDSAAYERLYQRHREAAMRLAWRYAAQRADAEDLVSTAFADILQALQRGSGPDELFRPYLLACVRRLGGRHATREYIFTLTGDEILPDPDQDLSTAQPLDRMLALEALAELPERQRLALWHAVVEGESADQIAVHLGVSPGNASVIIHRAKESLRQAFLAQHMATPRDLPACEVSADELAAYLRGGLLPRRLKRISAHVRTCPTCQARMIEAAPVEQGMRLLIAPAVLGVAVEQYLVEPSWMGSATRAATSRAAGSTGRKAAWWFGAAAVLVGGVLVWLSLSQPSLPDAVPAVLPTPTAGVVVSPPAEVETATPATQQPGDAPTPEVSATNLNVGSPTVGTASATVQANLTQSQTPLAYPGDEFALRITYTPQSGTVGDLVHVLVPEGLSVRAADLAAECELVGEREVVCGPYAAPTSVVVPVALAANAEPAAHLPGGSAWVADSAGAVVSGPIALQAQVHPDPCCVAPTGG